MVYPSGAGEVGAGCAGRHHHRRPERAAARLTGLETLAFNDGTPFADEVTLNWINQSVLDDMSGWRDEPVSAGSGEDNDILTLEPEALEKADTDGLDADTPLAADPPGHRRHKRQMAAAPADGAYSRAEGQK